MKDAIRELQDYSSLQSALLRPAQQANNDGAWELGWGTALVCFGLVPYLVAVLPKSAWTSAWTASIGFLPLVCAAFAPYGIQRIIKRFITWPRTGYFANANDVKLKQLVMLLGFGLALGFSLTQPFMLVSEIRQAIRHPGAPQTIILHCCELLVCVTVAVYLGRKTIRKRQPMPTAYDAEHIKHQLKQTAAGRTVWRKVWLTVLLLFIGIPMLAGGVVFGLIYLSKSATRSGEVSLAQIVVLSFIVAMNAILYLMGNAVAIKRYRWKWLVLTLLALGPIGVVLIIPVPALKPEVLPVLELFPPQVMLFMGLMWIISGLATLVSFLRHNPLPAPDAA